jgi:hypothetical protein
VHASIETILSDDRLDDETCETSKCELIEELISQIGWREVCDSLVYLLKGKRRSQDYEVAAQVIWGAVLDNRALPSDQVIALLYDRLNLQDDIQENLAWSITSKLKGVGYHSEYNPLHDPAVVMELEALREDLEVNREP